MPKRHPLDIFCGRVATAEDLRWTEAQVAGLKTLGTAGMALVNLWDRSDRRQDPLQEGSRPRGGLSCGRLGPPPRPPGSPPTGSAASVGALLALVRSLADLSYAEQAIKATYLNELVA